VKESVDRHVTIARRNEARRGGTRMQIDEVAGISPGRMLGAGLAHVLIGLAWSIGPIVGFVADPGAAKADWRVVAAVVILWPLGVPILLRGIGLLQQSFGGNGYFRASVDGLELRLGGPSLYARFMRLIPTIRALPANPDTFATRFPEVAVTRDGSSYVYRLGWREIASFDISLFALVIELRSGARLLLRRFYFSGDVVAVGRRLTEITQRLRTTNPLPEA
jgi:hypothetical protein